MKKNKLTKATAPAQRGLAAVVEPATIARAWAHQPRGRDHAEAFFSFLQSRVSPRTRKQYERVLTEFWQWVVVVRNGEVPTPAEVRRAEAVAYIRFLLERPHGLGEVKLGSEGREGDLAIFRAVKARPGSRLSQIAKAIGTPENVVEGHLRTMLRQDRLLRREPTLAQIRSGAVDVGLSRPDHAEWHESVSPDVYRYFLRETPGSGAADRSATVSQKISVLSSFWQHLIDHSGENADGGTAALLRHNIWRALRKPYARRARDKTAIRRAQTTPGFDLMVRVLAVTFEQSHGPLANDAAAAVLRGKMPPRALGEASLPDLRDRAVIVFSALVGERADELRQIRRREYADGAVLLHGKGDRPRMVVVPRVAQFVIEELENLLASPKLELPPRRPDDALFPTLDYRGANVAVAEDGRGLGRTAWKSVLHRLAARAGIRSPSDLQKLHPHGLRHFAAQQARKRGVELEAIKKVFGHASVATTSIYSEIRDEREATLFPEDK